MVTLSDGRRDQLTLYSDPTHTGVGLAALVYPRDLDIHRIFNHSAATEQWCGSHTHTWTHSASWRTVSHLHSIDQRLTAHTHVVHPRGSRHAVECVQMSHIPRMRPSSDTIDPGGRGEITTYGVIERTTDGAIERTADGLNPLTINLTAMTIS